MFLCLKCTVRYILPTPEQLSIWPRLQRVHVRSSWTSQLLLVSTAFNASHTLVDVYYTTVCSFPPFTTLWKRTEHRGKLRSVTITAMRDCLTTNGDDVNFQRLMLLLWVWWGTEGGSLYRQEQAGHTDQERAPPLGLSGTTLSRWLSWAASWATTLPQQELKVSEPQTDAPSVQDWMEQVATTLSPL